jgi:hypothetical protein
MYSQSRLERLAEEMQVPADELRWYVRMLIDEASRRRAKQHERAHRQIDAKVETPSPASDSSS